jgi:hypothetical protein
MSTIFTWLVGYWYQDPYLAAYPSQKPITGQHWYLHYTHTGKIIFIGRLFWGMTCESITQTYCKRNFTIKSWKIEIIENCYINTWRAWMCINMMWKMEKNTTTKNFNAYKFKKKNILYFKLKTLKIQNWFKHWWKLQMH